MALVALLVPSAEYAAGLCISKAASLPMLTSSQSHRGELLGEREAELWEKSHQLFRMLLEEC